MTPIGFLDFHICSIHNSVTLFSTSIVTIQLKSNNRKFSYLLQKITGCVWSDRNTNRGIKVNFYQWFIILSWQKHWTWRGYSTQQIQWPFNKYREIIIFTLAEYWTTECLNEWTILLVRTLLSVTLQWLNNQTFTGNEYGGHIIIKLM